MLESPSWYAYSMRATAALCGARHNPASLRCQRRVFRDRHAAARAVGHRRCAGLRRGRATARPLRGIMRLRRRSHHGNHDPIRDGYCGYYAALSLWFALACPRGFNAGRPPPPQFGRRIFKFLSTSFEPESRWPYESLRIDQPTRGVWRLGAQLDDRRKKLRPSAPFACLFVWSRLVDNLRPFGQLSPP